MILSVLATSFHGYSELARLKFKRKSLVNEIFSFAVRKRALLILDIWFDA